MQTSLPPMLARRGMSLLRLSQDEWENLEESRTRGSRFSMTFPHAIASSSTRESLVLISVEGDFPTLRVGLIRSRQAVSTFDTRVVFDLVRQIKPDSLAALLEPLKTTTLRSAAIGLEFDEQQFRKISPKLGRRLFDDVTSAPENQPAIQIIMAHIRKPSAYIDARATQQDAVNLALKTFGVIDGATTVSLPGGQTAIAAIRLQEDAVIEHDARSIENWELAGSDVTGRAVFEKRDQRLEVITANKRPLEELFGVDLIYFNQFQNALVMVQYKMMEPQARQSRRVDLGPMSYTETDEAEWLVPIDRQFTDEIERMTRFDRDLAPAGAYRLNSGAFFVKLVKRYGPTNGAGILLSLGHLQHLIESGEATGKRNGLRISYSALNGHYLRSDAFVELVRSGYIGTRDATTDHFQALIEATLSGGRSLVAAIHSATGARATERTAAE